VKLFIRMRDIIKQVLHEEHKDIKQQLQTIAEQFRAKIEKRYKWNENRRCFLNRCGNISKQLEKHLINLGFNAKADFGEYCCANMQFVPDMSTWEQWDIDGYYNMRGADEDEEGNEIFDTQVCYAHWWVLVNDKYIVDVTPDQFHPGEEEKFRIRIELVNETNCYQ
jgi:hypothetical protein